MSAPRTAAYRLRPALGLLAVALLPGCQRVGGPQVNLQRMIVQPRYEPYGPSHFFADGKAMQLPPAGTVARGTLPPAAAPARPDSDLLALGAEQYAIACAPCHGEEGDGRAIVAANLPGVPGLVLQTAAVRALSPDTLYARLGANAPTHHARARELSPTERWAVVFYVRALLARGAARAARDSLAAASRLAPAAPFHTGVGVQP